MCFMDYIVVQARPTAGQVAERLIQPLGGKKLIWEAFALRTLSS